VKSSKARCGAAGTVTDLRTGSVEVTWLGIGGLLEFMRRAPVAVVADAVGVVVKRDCQAQ